MQLVAVRVEDDEVAKAQGVADWLVHLPLPRATASKVAQRMGSLMVLAVRTGADSTRRDSGRGSGREDADWLGVLSRVVRARAGSADRGAGAEAAATGGAGVGAGVITPSDSVTVPGVVVAGADAGNASGVSAATGG